VFADPPNAYKVGERRFFSYLKIGKEKIVTEKKLDQQIDKKGVRPDQQSSQPKISTGNQKDALDETSLDKVSGGGHQKA
jgi:hypothetical protein